MPEVVIGTAGHVDHGKTQLVRALTGVDTDRLPEEKRRGISIDLGFAPCLLPSGRRAAIVDVPGHERFIRNMVAGATGMDLVLLVVAADEGVMPQTREHLDILHLLGVQAGAIALTKIDLVEPEWLELVEEEVREAVRGTFLEGAPVVRVSSVTGEGLDRLLRVVDELIPRVRPRPLDALPRLPIDRSFTVTGFGTVVTGTLAAGTVHLEDRLELLPAGIPVRVRHLQVHGRPVEQAVAGQRVALNLAGVGSADVQRGHVLAAPGALAPAEELAVAVQLLPHAPRGLRSGARVRLHVGTDEVIGRLWLLDRSELVPGERGYALFRAERPAVAAPGDRFIVRTFSPMHTVGGGTVLDTGRPYRRRPADVARLQARDTADPVARARAELRDAGMPLPEPELARRLLLTPEGFLRIRPRLLAEGGAVPLPEGFLVDGEVLERLRHRCVEAVEAFHRREPLRPGMPREELRAALESPPDPRAFAALLAHLHQAGALEVEGDAVHRPGYAPRLEEAAARELERLEGVFREAGLSPPPPAEAAARAGVDPSRASGLLEHLAAAGVLVRLAPDLYLHREAFEGAARTVACHIAEHGPATVAEVRDLLGTTRRLALPLLEAMDRQELTRRVGDRRVLTPRGQKLVRAP